jgi:hypothetical protein
MVVIRRSDSGPPGGIAQAFLDILLDMVGTAPASSQASAITIPAPSANGAAPPAELTLTAGRPGLADA